MLYPLKCTPILQDKIWGGTKLQSVLRKNSTTDMVGESWELSGLYPNESVVCNGFLASNTLSELAEIYMGDLLGDKIYKQYGISFPLLFKFIDATQNLSVQVHPNDDIAKTLHNCYGKTEMWYVVEAVPEATIVVGFENHCTKEKYLDALATNSLENLLQKFAVHTGDVFFIPAGTIHAIGQGVVLAEIQQSSDITYRIYDYNRTDEQGKPRTLHQKQAIDAINFETTQSPRIDYNKELLNEIVPLVNCEYFTTHILRFNKTITRNYATLDSFRVYICLDGGFDIVYSTQHTTVYKGDTMLIPACIDEVDLVPHQESLLLETYIDTICL